MDGHLRLGVDPVAPPHAQQLPDGRAANGVLHVVVKDAGRAGVAQHVGVALLQVRAREGPVLEAGAGVVVVNEGDGVRGGEPDQPRRVAVLIHQPPALPLGDRLLQHRLGGKIKRGGAVAGGDAPGELPVAVRILARPQHALLVLAAVPELAHREPRLAALNVLTCIHAAESHREVQPPPVKLGSAPQPGQPRGVVVSHPWLRVVDVGGRCVEGAGGGRAAAAIVRQAVGRNDALVPGRVLPEPVPQAAGALLRCASVVEHDVRHHRQPRPVRRANQALQLRRRAVGCVQVVEVSGEVALWAYADGRWRQP
mmetsp:Transcript_5367/g.13711  ORF Transcript_5367/g.13711 Transcript_5367/m.13711 type:complete len:311 (+) Transcript_5367:397-1329(+)